MRLLVRNILKEEAEKVGITIDEAIEKNSDRKAMEVRWKTAWIAKVKYNFSYKHIGRIIKRDHSTVIHSVKKMNEWGGNFIYTNGLSKEKQKKLIKIRGIDQ